MDEQHAHEHPPVSGIGGGAECVLCPICVLLQAVTSLRPEVTEHLLAAARELTLALQAALDAQTRTQNETGDKLQRIRLD